MYMFNGAHLWRIEVMKRKPHLYKKKKKMKEKWISFSQISWRLIISPFASPRLNLIDILLWLNHVSLKTKPSSNSTIPLTYIHTHSFTIWPCHSGPPRSPSPERTPSIFSLNSPPPLWFFAFLRFLQMSSDSHASNSRGLLCNAASGAAAGM